MYRPFVRVGWIRSTRWLRRGDIRLLVLEALKKRPMHGYEIGKEIAERFGGFYEPSPGVVYPTLQWLEDEGYVEVAHENGKKVYRIKEAGSRFLEEKHGEVKQVFEACRGFLEDEKLELMKEGRRLGRTLLLLSTDMSDENVQEVVKILEDARMRIMKLMSE